MKEIRWLFFFFILFLSSISVAQEDLVSKTGFNLFSEEWIKKLIENGCYRKNQLCILPVQGNPKRFVAQYQEMLKVVSKEVKATGVKESPYIGILKYETLLYESEGSTPEEAKKGPFECKKHLTVTEIFRFSNGKWLSY